MNAPVAARAEWMAGTAVKGLLALVVLTPLVVGSDVVYPFVVGKALYARVLIALAFALWAVLALARPAWRPPRSALLVLLGVGAAVAVLAAAFGVSPRHSAWSYYGRMEGLFDLAHWVAFAVVAAAVLRTRRDWALVLGIGLAVGTAAALSAVAQRHAPGLLPLPRLGPMEQPYGTLGNPGYLGGCLQATVLLAAGVLARPFARGAADGGERRWVGRRLAVFAGTALAAAASVWALLLSGSVGAAAGLVAGAGWAALMLAWTARRRAARIAALAAVVALAAVPAFVAGTFAWRAQAGGVAAGGAFFGVRLLDRITSPYDLEVSAGARLANWRAGVAAFAERPLLGWGTGNYLAASGRHLAVDSGRYLPNRGEVNEGRDHAHNMVIEEAATKGLAGLLAYAALWGWTGVAAFRAVRRADAADRALAACAGGALAGWFVQSQTFFYSPAAWLVHMLLLAWLASREHAGRREAPRRSVRPAAMAGRVAAVVAALGVAVGSLAANRAVHAGAAALHRAETEPAERFMLELEASIRAFEPMATHGRILLFENVATNWAVLRARYPGEAFRLLAWSGREAPKALAAEPHNWQLHHALAHLYREVAKTEPDHAPLAARFDASARAVAPHLDPLLPMRPGR